MDFLPDHMHLLEMLLLAMATVVFVICYKQRKQLKQNSAFLQLIFDNVPEIMFVKDAQCRIMKANKKFIDLYPPEKQNKIIGFTTVEDYDPEETKAFLAEDNKALETGFSNKHETIDFPDGKKRTLNTKKVRFYDKNNQPFILGIATDITEQMKMVEDTENSQSMLRMIMDFFPGYVFVKDSHSNILYANQNFLNVYPLEKQNEVVGRTMLDHYPEEVRAKLIEQDQKALREGEIHEEQIVYFPNGQRINAVVRKKCFTNNKGDDFILCVITERA
jgi:PAS domain S-box-containing protein